MIRTRIIPCLLYQNQGLVKTVRFKNPRYLGDPINIVRLFNDKEAHELVFLDISATVEGRKPSLKLISEVASECFMPLAYGGGIRSLGEIEGIFNAGVEKVVINSYAAENPAFIQEAAKRFGSQSIVVSIDVKGNLWGRKVVMTHGGTRKAKIDLPSYVKLVEEMGAGEIFLNSIDRDGCMNGYDLETIRDVSALVNIPVIACGGAGSVNDFASAVHQSGAAAVSAGSMFVYQGPHRAVLINFPVPHELKKFLD